MDGSPVKLACVLIRQEMSGNLTTMDLPMALNSNSKQASTHLLIFLPGH